MKLVRSSTLSFQAITALKQRNGQVAPFGNTTSLLTASGLVIACTFAFGIVNTQAAGLANNALPTGGQVAAGQATISQSSNTMNINQSTQRAVINWNSFNVGANSTVNFNQPNANSSTLNRVNSASKSMINGAVNSNGQVIFINPNGVVFGKGAEVNTGGIVATTMNISDADYMSGKSTYSGGETGKVINRGTITVNNINGYIALMAPEVKNEGVLIATLSGNNAIALVSGQQVTLSISGNQLIHVTVDASAINSLISNKRLIKTDGGQVIIAANSASDLRSSAMNNTGIISASAVKNEGGRVFLTAGTVNQSGTVSANSEQANGGEITISGNLVNLNATSKTSATGATSGGQILVGKTAQNTALSQVNANTVNVAQSALVDVSSTQNGNGGSISIWSQIASNVAGVLKATGGIIAGNGGNIETSSAGKVAFGKGLVVDTSAPHGKFGNWLTDPLSIIIDESAATILSNALTTTNVTLDASASSCAGIGNCTTSSIPQIHFLSGTSVFSTADTALTLKAPGGTITMDGNIAVGQVYAVAQTINVNGSVNTTNGSNGSIYLAGTVINILGNINSNGRNSNNTNSSTLNTANTITANNRRNGKNGLTADSSNTYTSNGGAINIIASGDINISTNSYISSNGINGGTINAISVNGNINNYGVIDAVGNGNNGIGGAITIAAKNTTIFSNSLVSADGHAQGGIIKIGIANGVGSNSTLAPSSISSQVATLLAAVNFTQSNNIFSSNSTLDNNTVITANAASSTSQVVLNTQAGQIYIVGNNSLNTAATISANADNGGLIVLSSPVGSYQNTGYVQANGMNGLGGTIAQSGLISTTLIGAKLESNGATGGGNIITGRDFQANPLPGSAAIDALLPALSAVIIIPTSQLTTVDAGSAIIANALTSGNGGNILVWGNSNSVAGTLSAKALGTSGNGGFIETSGDALSIATGSSVSAASIHGKSGTWLLDPYDVMIEASGAIGTTYSSNFIAGAASRILASAINASLNSGTNVLISTGSDSSNTIFVNSAITATSGSASLTLTGGTINLAANITTSGSQTYNGAVTLSADTTLTGNGITFNSIVDASSAGAYSLNISDRGITNFKGAVGGTVPLEQPSLTSLRSLNVTSDAGININGGSITTSGSQTYSGAVTLGATTGFKGNGITFNSTIDGAHELFLYEKSTTSFNGIVGSITPLTLLQYRYNDSAGVANINTSSITVNGPQYYNSIILSADTTLITKRFYALINGAHALTIIDSAEDDGGPFTFIGGGSGGSTPLTTLNVTSTRGIGFPGNITTSGSQTYNSAVTLFADTTLTGNGITFNSTVDASTVGNQSLSISDGGTTNFNGAVGSVASLSSLNVTSAAGININGGSIKTSGSQSYNSFTYDLDGNPVVGIGAVTLGADTTLTGNGITFNSTVDASSPGAQSLSISDGGTTNFNGAVGSVASLSSLNVTSDAGININGGSVKTSGSQSYNSFTYTYDQDGNPVVGIGAVTLGADTTLTGNGITFNSTVDASSPGAQSLSISDRGTTNFNGAVGSIASLKLLNVTSDAGININGGSVTTSGSQIYIGAVTLGALTNLNGNSITFGSSVDGNYDLMISDKGVTNFNGMVGGSNPLSSLDVTSDAVIIVGGSSVTTSGSQTYNGAVALGVDTTLTGNGITFKSTVDASTVGNQSLSISDRGTTNFNGAVGESVQLKSLDVTSDAGININGGSVTTTGSQKYNSTPTSGAGTIFTENYRVPDRGYSGIGDENSATPDNESSPSTDTGTTTATTKGKSVDNNIAITGSGPTAIDPGYRSIATLGANQAATTKDPGYRSTATLGANQATSEDANTLKGNYPLALAADAPSGSSTSLASGNIDTSSAEGNYPIQADVPSSSSSSKNGSTSKEKKNKKDSKAMTAKERQNTFVAIPSPGFYGSNLVKGQERYTLLPDENGKVGAITVTIGAATSLIDDAYVSVNVDGNQAPIFDNVNQSILRKIYQNIQQGVPRSAAQ